MAHKNKAKKAKASAAEMITLHLMVRAQARNRPVSIKDAEHSFRARFC